MKKEKFDFSLSLGRTSHQDTVLAPSNHLGYMKALNKKRKKLGDRIQIYLDRKSYEESHIIYAASEMMKNELIELYQVPANKIHILHPPINTPEFIPELKRNQQELKTKWGMHPQKLSFVFVSTNHKIKGLPLLLNIFKELDPEKYELIVLGDRIKQEVSDHVIYLGYQTELYEIYAAADLLIHPSIYEAFGQIVTESLQSGTPVIISNMVGAKEVIKNHEGLIISSFDAKDWVNQITGLEKSQFRLSPTISEDKGLSISQHIDKMLIIWQENKSL